MVMKADAVQQHLDLELAKLKDEQENHFTYLKNHVEHLNNYHSSLSKHLDGYILVDAKKGEETLKLRLAKEANREKQRLDAEEARRKAEEAEEELRLKNGLTREQLTTFREAYNIRVYGDIPRLMAFLDFLQLNDIGQIASHTIQIRLSFEHEFGILCTTDGLLQEITSIGTQGGFHANITKDVAKIFWKCLNPEAFPHEIFNRDYLKNQKKQLTLS